MNTNNEKYQYNGTGTQNYNLTIDKDGINIEGDFYKIINREIIKSDTKKEHISFDGYLGMSQLSIRSEKKLNYPIYVYLGFAAIKFIYGLFGKITGYIDTASDIINKNYAKVAGSYIGDAIKSLIPIPTSISFIDILFCIVQVAIAVLIFVYIFSKKSVYEISSIDKRVAVDKSTMDNGTFLKMCKFAEKMKDANKK